jgi:hypothetical protein
MGGLLFSDQELAGREQSNFQARGGAKAKQVKDDNDWNIAYENGKQS